MAGSGTAHLRDRADLVLQVRHLVMEFPAGGGSRVHAVSDLSFDVAEGETLGLVGESGCGKSTTARAVMQLPRPTSGTVTFEGRDLDRLAGRELRRARMRLQMIFQDPTSSLNPRRSVRNIVAEPLIVAGAAGAHRARVEDTLSTVGIDPGLADRRPHQFSGGQCQRISIARALVTEPKMLICDEPVSALDVSIQAQVLNLLEDMKDRYGLAMLFISHDLSVVKNIADRVAVMYLGKLCEMARSDALYERPAHPYTRALLDAVPVPTPAPVTATFPIPSGIPSPVAVPAGSGRPGLAGELPSAVAPPSGCRFRTRCPRVQPRCVEEEPLSRPAGEDHYVACHYPLAPSATG